eukprot:Colp12_sorted_trinity150504_noHs@21720
MEEWLRNVLRGNGYRNDERTHYDVCILLTQFPNLRPKVEVYTWEDGRTSQMLCLAGTVPITYKGARYNIPIDMWVSQPYPMQPPKVYVTPTKDMVVKVSRHVDAAGLVYHPYLHEWKAQTSSLLELAGTLVAIFSADPPLYRKPDAAPSNAPPARPPAPAPGYGSAGPYGYPGQQPQAQPPSSSSYGPPARPPPPAISTDGSGAAGSYGSNNRSPYGSDYNLSANMQNMQLAELRSLQSAVNESARSRLRAYNEAAHKELTMLFNTQEQLKQGTEQLDKILAAIDDDNRKAQEASAHLEAKTLELQQLLAKYQSEPEIDPDDAVGTTAPLYTQILNLVSEEHAIEDTIYYLSKALNNDTIDLPTFLKHVRQLTRTQFILRATLKKARQVAGL